MSWTIPDASFGDLLQSILLASCRVLLQDDLRILRALDVENLHFALERLVALIHPATGFQ